MATNQIVPAATAAEAIRKWFNQITLTNWDNNNKPFVTIGSTFEVGGSVFQVQTADEDPDSTAAFAGFGLNTLCYCRTVPGTPLTLEMTTTAPSAWDDDKQGYYDAGGTKRYLFQIYKDASANWTQKTIILGRDYGITNGGVNVGIGANADRVLRVAGDAAWEWDETSDRFYTDKQIYSKILSSSFGATSTQNDVFDLLVAKLYNTGDKILISGAGRRVTTGNTVVFSFATKTGATSIEVYYYDITTQVSGSVVCNNGDATSIFYNFVMAF